MLSTPSFLGLLAVVLPSLVVAAPAPAPTPAAKLEDRATTCTFTNAASASASKKSCATIVLSAIPVPSGVTLDLTGLTQGTHVIFEGETTFGFEEWSGPLVSVSGTDITVTASSGAFFNGDGARWWDGKPLSQPNPSLMIYHSDDFFISGQGSNGGVTKPKFFYARKSSFRPHLPKKLDISDMEPIPRQSHFLYYYRSLFPKHAGPGCLRRRLNYPHSSRFHRR